MFSSRLLQRLVLSLLHASLSIADYTQDAETAASSLFGEWYNSTSGLWVNQWWQSANTMTTLGDLAAVDATVKDNITAIFANTHSKAQNTFSNFISDYYDDEGWWALAWIQAYDITQNSDYLDTAVTLFDDMTTGWGTSPCGGLWWNKEHTTVNAISNELFLSVAVHLANRMTGKSSLYLTWAQKEWDFFASSGMINGDHNINDGLNKTTCKNNGETVWTYNQGVILGALVEYNKALPNSSFINTANSIATAALKSLTDPNGILKESCDPNCDQTAAQFKGVFARNLQTLQRESSQKEYTTFIEKNANSIWTNDRDKTANGLGSAWAGPFSGTANATTQSSALDALVAAIAVPPAASQTEETPATTVTVTASSSTAHATSSSSGIALQISLGCNFGLTAFAVIGQFI